MISREQNTALLIVGNAASQIAGWKCYSEYCLAREKGLRTEAFKQLDDFIKSASNWTFDQSLDFVKFLLTYCDTVAEADYGPFPHPVKEKIVKPTLESWCAKDETDSRPFRWYGKYFYSEEHLLKAIEINPHDDLARDLLIGRWAYDLYYSVHHLPEGYLGIPADDIALSEKIISQITLLQDEKLRKKWKDDIDEDIELIKNYIDFKNSGSSDLKAWGMANNKRISY